MFPSHNTQASLLCQRAMRGVVAAAEWWRGCLLQNIEGACASCIRGFKVFACLSLSSGFIRAAMRCFLPCCILLLAASCLVLARGDSLPCADATLLLPFVELQLKQSMSLVVFQGTAAPQVWGLGFGVWGLNRS